MTLVLLLSVSSLLAGFIDAVVGGGGLIQIPAMLILVPGAPVATILGTNKFASFAGTTIAVQRYARHVAIDWPTVLPAALTAFVFSFLGSRTVTLLNTAFMRPIVLVLLVLVAIYVFFVKDLGLIHEPRHAPKKRNGSAFLSAPASASTTASSARAPAAFSFFCSSEFSGSIFSRRRPRPR